MPQVELRRLIGKMRDSRTGKLLNVGWNIDQLFLDGKQIATINRVPGSPVGLMAGVLLTTDERAAVESTISKARGGVKPSKIGGAISVDSEVLDEAEDTIEPEVTELDDE